MAVGSKKNAESSSVSSLKFAEVKKPVKETVDAG